MLTRALPALAAILLLANACGGQAAEEPEPGWRTSGVQAASSPVGAGSTVAVLDGASVDVKMLVLDAATGRRRFSRPWSPSARYPGTGVGQPAAFPSAVVSMEASGLQTLLLGSDPRSGTQLWRAEVSETFGPFVCGELLCSEDNWSLPSAALVARDPSTGEIRWSSPGSQIHVYAGRDLVVEQDLNEPVLRSIDPANGQQRWRTDLRAALGPEATPVVAEAQLAAGTLVVESNPNRNAPNGTVGLDPSTGSVKWSHPDFGLCPPPMPDVVLVCGRSGLQRLDPGSGQALWSTDQFRPPAQAGPLIGVSGDLSRVLGRTADGKPLAIGVEDGQVSEVQAGLSFVRFATNEEAKKNPNAPAGRYLGPLDPVPWNFKAGEPASVGDAADLPEFIGLTLEGSRVFLDASGNLRALPSES